MIALSVAAAATVLAAIALASALPRRGLVAFWLAVALLAQALAVAGILVAGLVFRNLGPTWLLAAAFAELLVGGVIWLRAGGRHTWSSRSLGAVRAVAGAAREWPVAIALLLVVGTLAWRVFLVLRLPIVDYDGWSYHLVFTDVWLQHNALTLVPQRPWTAGYPADGELLTTWFTAFTGTDATVGFASIATIPLGIISVVGLARSLGARPGTAVLVGLLFGMTPALIAQAGTSYIDAGSVGTVAATWWLGVRVLRGEKHWTTALLLGIAGGLAIGTKATNLLLVTPMLAVVGLALLRDALANWRTPRVPGLPAARIAAASLIALAIPVLAIGASWYLKNIVVYGNPFYPFGIAGLPGVLDFASLRWAPPKLEAYPPIEQVFRSWIADWHLDRYLYNVRPGGLGRAWPLILVLGVLGLGLAVRGRHFALALLAVVPAIVTVIAAPNPWYARYTLFLPALGVAFGALVLDALRPRMRAVASAVLVGTAAISLAFVNIRPNIDVKAAFDGTGGSSPRQYLALLLDPSDERRGNVNLRALCAGLEVIPDGAWVTPAGFTPLHGIPGPERKRFLTDPIVGPITPEALVARLRALGSGWLVTTRDNTVDRAAQGTNGALIDHGAQCEDGWLWELPNGESVVGAGHPLIP